MRSVPWLYTGKAEKTVSLSLKLSNMNKLILVLVLSITTGALFAQTAKKPAPKTATKPVVKTASTLFKNNNDSVSYGLGIRIMQNLKAQGLQNVNLAMVQRAMTDASLKKTPLLNDADINACMGRLQQQMDAERAKENAAKSSVGIREGQAFLAANAKRAGVVSLPSGLQYEVIKAGTGTEKPTLNSNVKCHYTGTLLNGTKFDSSVDRGEPITFKLSNVILGWQEALQLMTVGSKWKLYIPANLAYGDNPPPGGVITAGSTLVFDVELLGIEN